MHTARARLVLSGLSACWAMMAWGFTTSRSGEVLWPHIWSWIFGLASATTLWLALTLSRPPLFVSLSIITFGLVGRLGAVWLQAVEGFVSPPSLTLTVVAYLVLLALISGTWVRVLGPIVSWHDQQEGGGACQPS